MTESMQIRDHDVPRCVSSTPAFPASIDANLACLVRQALRELAAHSPSYANVFANRTGVRLAHQIAAGQVAELTEAGRRCMRSAYLSMQAAAAVEPGLDTNILMDRLTGRRNPRQAMAADPRLDARTESARNGRTER